jgi:hypothetical protein
MRWRTVCRVAAPPRSDEVKHHHAHTLTGHSPLKFRSRDVSRPTWLTAGSSVRWRSAHGLVLSLNYHSGGSGVATGQPGSARRAAEAVFAALRLPYAARVRGPVAQLAAPTAFAPLEQARRVRSRGALRARAPAPVLLGASHARRALPGCPVAGPDVACATSNTALVAGKAAGGAWAGRIGAAEEHRPSGRAPWRASSSDSSHLSERSERSERSELCDGPEGRAPQGTRSAAKGQPSEPRPGAARRLARADAGTNKERTHPNNRNGPRTCR